MTGSGLACDKTTDEVSETGGEYNLLAAQRGPKAEKGLRSLEIAPFIH